MEVKSWCKEPIRSSAIKSGKIDSKAHCSRNYILLVYKSFSRSLVFGLCFKSWLGLCIVFVNVFVKDIRMTIAPHMAHILVNRAF
jgi:hypothetical protein